MNTFPLRFPWTGARARSAPAGQKAERPALTPAQRGERVMVMGMIGTLFTGGVLVMTAAMACM